MFILLLIFGILLQILVVGGCVILILKYLPKKTTSLIKIKQQSSLIVPVVKIKRTTNQPYDSIYTPSTDGVPVRHSGGNLVPYGLTDEEKAALKMFYG